MDKTAEALFAPIGSTLEWPDTRIIEREGWHQTITPSSGTAIGNEVVHSVVGEAEIDAVIERTCAEYAMAGVPFKWCVTPRTLPADTGARLAARGFRAVSLRAMSIEPRAWTATAPSDVSVELVTTETLDEYRVCFETGWSLPAPLGDWRLTHARAMASGRYEMFIARIGGVAVGTAGSVLKAHSVYLVGGNVLSDYRTRGVYRALLATRLARAAAAGKQLAVTQAREESSAPILERLGFESLCTVTMYRND